MTEKSLSELANNPSCQDDYAPDAMSVAQARQFIVRYLSPVQETETLNLLESLGRILAEDTRAPEHVPNHDNSAMDGYAFNSADAVSCNNQGVTTLKIVGSAFAGNPYTGRVQAGVCVRIMTGAVIPEGADSVIAQEKVSVSADSIQFSDAIKPGLNVRYAGEDIKVGQVVLPSGHLMRPADLGMVASLGQGWVKVYRRLRVAFFSTGDELVSLSSSAGQAAEPLQTGQLYDSNRYSLHGLLTRLGVEIIDLGIIGDDPQRLEQTLLKASQVADVILTSGGVSVGEADFMKQLLTKLGEVLFWKIAMKPGRPLAYGKVGQAHYFGLPGNPVAVMVTFYQFVRAALLLLMGQTHAPAQPLFKALCSAPIKKLKGRTEFQRGILYLAEDGSWQVQPTGNQSSGVLSSMSLANCFIVLSEEVGNLDAHSWVEVQVMDGIV